MKVTATVIKSLLGVDRVGMRYCYLNADGITHGNLGPKEQMEYLLHYMRAHRNTILRHQNWYRCLIRRLCFQAASAGLERDFKVMRNLQNPAGVEMRTELQKCAKPKLIKVPDAEYSSREIAHKRITLFLSTFQKMEPLRFGTLS